MSQYASTQEIFDVHLPIIAWSTDSVSNYLENKPAGLLRDEQKARDWKATIQMVVELTPVVKQFPLVMPLVLRVPVWVMRWVSPDLNRVLVMHKVCPCSPSPTTLPSAILISASPNKKRGDYANELSARHDISKGSCGSIMGKPALEMIVPDKLTGHAILRHTRVHGLSKRG